VTRLTVENYQDRESLLCVYVEPLANDYWIAPGQKLTFAAETSKPELDVIWHATGVTLWLDDADPYLISVTTEDGVEVECGFQRP